MTKSFTLKDLSFYDREIEQYTDADYNETQESLPDMMTINYILAYAHALYVINSKFIGPVSLLLN
jgi:hypothetical protein